MITAKDIAMAILALPEEQQNLPIGYSYYSDMESSVPDFAFVDCIQYNKSKSIVMLINI